MILSKSCKPNLLATTVIIATTTLSTGVLAASHPNKIGNPVASGRFQVFNEPSGVIALKDNTLILVEDESRNALRRLELTGDNPGRMTMVESNLSSAKNIIQQKMLDDLEGIARISENQFIVIGSHQKASRGKQPERAKIVLFDMEGDDVTNAFERGDLFNQLEKNYPDLTQIMTQKGGDKDDREPLNIEGLAFDRKRMHLYIGLRTPLVHHDAVIIRLDNAVDYLMGKDPEFSDQFFTLDLKKGGIRALAYDDTTDQLLLVSKREDGGKKRSRLWTFKPAPGAEAVRFKSDDKDLFDKVEGVTPLTSGLFFIRDQGEDRELDDWFVLERQQLGLEVSHR